MRSNPNSFCLASDLQKMPSKITFVIFQSMVKFFNSQFVSSAPGTVQISSCYILPSLFLRLYCQIPRFYWTWKMLLLTLWAVNPHKSFSSLSQKVWLLSYIFFTCFTSIFASSHLPSINMRSTQLPRLFSSSLRTCLFSRYKLHQQNLGGAAHVMYPFSAYFYSATSKQVMHYPVSHLIGKTKMRG